MENCKVSSSKHQITNKSQIPILVLRTPHPAGGSPVSMTKTGLEFRILVIVIWIFYASIVEQIDYGNIPTPWATKARALPLRFNP